MPHSDKAVGCQACLKSKPNAIAPAIQHEPRGPHRSIDILDSVAEVAVAIGGLDLLRRLLGCQQAIPLSGRPLTLTEQALTVSFA
jgi:hypothetical protein